MLPKAVGSGLKWLDNRFTGGAVQSFDTKVLGGAVQHSLGVKTDREEQTEDFLKQLEALKFDNAFAPGRASSMFNGGTANMQSSSLTKPYVPLKSNGLVPKADFVYWFHQLDEVLARRRGTVGQTTYLDAVSSWVDAELEWFDSQPDWVDEYHTRPFALLDCHLDKRQINEDFNEPDSPEETKKGVMIPAPRQFKDLPSRKDIPVRPNKELWPLKVVEKTPYEIYAQKIAHTADTSRFEAYKAYEQYRAQPISEAEATNSQTEVIPCPQEKAESFEAVDALTGRDEFSIHEAPLRK
jgi:hypothetical protein